MRSSFVVVLVSLVACGSDPGEDEPELELAFEVASSAITLQPGEETTKCFYFTTPNTETVAIHKWVSDMTPGSHHMIMFRSLDGMQAPDGTIDEACSSGIPVPVYGTQIPHEEVLFPNDDGFGKTLAQDIPAGSKGFFQMHYFNTSDDVLSASVVVKAYKLPADTLYTRTDLFATYNADIAIPPGATNHVVSATCDTVLGKFWSLSSHSHKQSIATAIKENGTVVFESTDWEHPGTKEFRTAPFYTFDSGKLTWECTYNNTGDNANRTITSGQSAQTDEMCMATGYYFPAVGPRGCFMTGGQCRCVL